MKKIVSKICMAIVATVVFGATMFLSMGQNEEGKWEFTTLRAMAQGGEDNGECRTSCVTGGCGSSSCTYTKEIFGFNRTVSTTAQPGYYACCYDDGTDMYANSYPNSCCSSN